MGAIIFRLLVVFAVVVCFCCCHLTNTIDSFEDDVDSGEFKLLEKLKKQIKEKEAELEKAEKINKNFERMIQLVNIMGQVDTFLTDRTKIVLKKLALLADDLDGAKGKRKKL